MSILLAIIGAMGALGILLWRLNQAAEATKGLAETAQELAGLKRRWNWRRKANADPLTLVDDPRVAGVAMMAAIAQADGAQTTAERDTILRLSIETFQCTPKVAEELLAYGRFLVRDTQDPANCFRKLLPLIRKSCDRQQRADLIGMLKAVAAADGKTGDAEAQTIERLARELATG